MVPLALSATAGCSRAGGGASSAEPKTEDDKIIYASGYDIGQSIQMITPTDAEVELIRAGMNDAVHKIKPKVDVDKYGPQIQVLIRKRSLARAEIEKAKAPALVEAALKEPNAVKLPSGAVAQTTRPGTGAQPEPADRVKVNYEGRLADGAVFDSSYKRNEPAVFQLNGVIKCWTEGVGHMKVGEKAKLTCPADTAYGDGGRPPKIPGGATLIFDVELLDVMKAPPPPTPPPAATPGAPGAKPAPAGKPAKK
ncbi:MAG TPA: FKBP-type peptidyl-prolyl cis-trans isomerase [Polyangia bacterium]|nr:FKBP-type peptidyl-prolyl cis-trans isomerase [Polyangia bacterium]